MAQLSLFCIASRAHSFTDLCSAPRFREGTWSPIRGSVGCGSSAVHVGGDASSWCRPPMPPLSNYTVGVNGCYYTGWVGRARHPYRSGARRGVVCLSFEGSIACRSKILFKQITVLVRRRLVHYVENGLRVYSTTAPAPTVHSGLYYMLVTILSHCCGRCAYSTCWSECTERH